MIRYRVSSADWSAAIDAIAPTWRTRAASRTAVYAAAGRYSEPPSTIWSEIKSVYMDLQGFKCGFCERRLEKSEFGNVEHDVEHFRPKSQVSAWPPNSAPERADGLDFDRAAFATIGAIALQGVRRADVRIGERFALADAADAHRALEGRATTGKVVLLP